LGSFATSNFAPALKSDLKIHYIVETIKLKA